MIDLHTHSTASDGTYSPSELVHLAKKEGLKALALTDHDTLQGLKEAYETSQVEGLEFLCGVEISIKIEGPGHFHLLGYFLTPEIPSLETTLLSLQKARDKRNKLMLEKLQALGIDITLEELENIAQGEIGRPHFAKLLIQKGVVKTFQEAFDRYLKKGAPAYVPKALLTPEEGINKILQSGGIPVLAHPITLKLNEKELSNYLAKLKELGIKGVEVYYSEHSKTFTEFLYTVAKRLDLLITGGSDFHGTNKPDIKLGRGFGNLKIPYEVFLKLKEALEKISS
ncbi:phosphoesterase [Caldimicrobium thiodismutans]|uniref:Phosphoesterase n=1 Tax=Caldimicrobium thiodismutans TaxID=1653476 RepID=A0A0U5AVN6_9BACT|nr:PHP domain-containing protein [Caldimicrobium thiodismutans]BAU22431.1 phosphoesterase [Caldimicrobium thiodismutans]